MKINVLGTEYTVIQEPLYNNKALENVDGYCDETTKKIHINDIWSDPNYQTGSSSNNLTARYNTILRHELVHAFLYESGLGTESFNMNELAVDWIARMIPKMAEAMDIIDHPVFAVDTVFVCDRKALSCFKNPGCVNQGGDCHITNDITHAENFEVNNDGKYVERVKE